MVGRGGWGGFGRGRWGGWEGEDKKLEVGMPVGHSQSQV